MTEEGREEREDGGEREERDREGNGTTIERKCDVVLPPSYLKVSAVPPYTTYPACMGPEKLKAPLNVYV